MVLESAEMRPKIRDFNLEKLAKQPEITSLNKIPEIQSTFMRKASNDEELLSVPFISRIERSLRKMHEVFIKKKTNEDQKSIFETGFLTGPNLVLTVAQNLQDYLLNSKFKDLIFLRPK